VKAIIVKFGNGMNAKCASDAVRSGDMGNHSFYSMATLGARPGYGILESGTIGLPCGKTLMRQPPYNELRSFPLRKRSCYPARMKCINKQPEKHA
jgi:hypothetical protein